MVSTMLDRITNWRADGRTLLKRAWSIRFTTAAVVCSGLEVGFSILANDPPIPRGVFAALSAVNSGLAVWARLVAQKGITPGADE